MSITQFMDHHFRHFNARETVDAAKAWKQHVEQGGKMLLAMAGAMSTAELGISLAKMIRAGKVHAISCTAANFEEDIFNLVAHNEYRMVPHYRDLSPDGRAATARRRVQPRDRHLHPRNGHPPSRRRLMDYWIEAGEKGESHFASEYFYRLFEIGVSTNTTRLPKEDSWCWPPRDRHSVYAPG